HVRLDTWSSLAARHTRVARSGIRAARSAVRLVHVGGDADAVLGVGRVDLAARHLAGTGGDVGRARGARGHGRAHAGRRVAALVALIGGTVLPRVRGLAVPRQTPRMRAEVVVGLVGLGTAARRRRAVGLTQMPGNTDTVLGVRRIDLAARDLPGVHGARLRAARVRGRWPAQTRRRAAAPVSPYASLFRSRVRGLAVPRQTPRMRAEVVVGLVGLGTAARRCRAVGLTHMPGNTD